MVKRHGLIVLLFCTALTQPAFAQKDAQPVAMRGVPVEVLTPLKSARTWVQRHGDTVWPGFRRAPFGFLLVEKDRELLLCDTRVPDGFRPLGRNESLRCSAATGPSSWRTANLQAAMPVFGPPSVIVMGSPSDTGLSPSEWISTVVHEHMHQWQAGLANYYDRVEALNLAGGDATGMWMLNYPFPYSEPKVVEAFASASKALAEAITATPDHVKAATEQYLQLRGQLSASVSVAQWRYYEFQLWQEGVARWTEIALANRVGTQTARHVAQMKTEQVLNGLRAPDLTRDARVSVYAMGAGEALLLERVRPNWRECYPRHLALGPLWDETCAQPKAR
jgi:hypothetical protein